MWYYIARESQSVEIADRVVDSVTNRFFLLATHPHVGRRRDEDLRPGLRSFPVGEYVIIYRVEGEDVLILRVPAAAAILKLYSEIDVLYIAGRHRFLLPESWFLSPAICPLPTARSRPGPFNLESRILNLEWFPPARES
ncbi:MAG: type II toxin-antitoxin system RelE/ParE family toxin [Acidobacteriota bacterium]|nr:type II toxin-antitoxin system RelE/ParE family toxin [Acidobacteriota bacterium]